LSTTILALVKKDSVSIKEVTPDLNKETLLRLCLAQRMWINIVVVALTLSQLGAAQESVKGLWGF